MKLAEPVLRLTALHGWVTPHRHDTTCSPWPLHWAVLSTADDQHQGTAACGLRLDRDRQWWRATGWALRHAAYKPGDLWRFCDLCLYWAGGLPCP